MGAAHRTPARRPARAPPALRGRALRVPRRCLRSAYARVHGFTRVPLRPAHGTEGARHGWHDLERAPCGPTRMCHTRRNDAAIASQLQSLCIAAGAVQDIEELMERDAQIAARGALVPLEHPLLGVFGHMRTPISFSTSKVEPFRAPSLGEQARTRDQTPLALAPARTEAGVALQRLDVAMAHLDRLLDVVHRHVFAATGERLHVPWKFKPRRVRARPRALSASILRGNTACGPFARVRPRRETQPRSNKGPLLDAYPDG